MLRHWQQQLSRTLGRETVMACRSIVYRILQFAEDEGAIGANAMRKVPAPPKPMDPDALLGQARRRAFTPHEAGLLLAHFPLWWWDHVIALLGTGMRFGEFAGLHKRRLRLDRPIPVIQVVDVRYEAGRFGRGFKPEPKSAAGVREIPWPVRSSRRSAASCRPTRPPTRWSSPDPAAVGMLHVARVPR